MSKLEVEGPTKRKKKFQIKSKPKFETKPTKKNSKVEAEVEALQKRNQGPTKRKKKFQSSSRLQKKRKPRSKPKSE